MFLIRLRLGSSVTILKSGNMAFAAAYILACTHVGGVLFDSISNINLSTCGNHSACIPAKRKRHNTLEKINYNMTQACIITFPIFIANIVFAYYVRHHCCTIVAASSA